MAHIRLSTLDKTFVERDTTEEPFPVTIRLRDDEDNTIEFRLSGMTSSETEEFRGSVRILLQQLDELVAEWEDQPDWSNDGYICPPHESRDGNGWYVRFEGKDVATGVPDREIALFLLAEAMTKAGHFPAAWETGRDWAPQPVDDEVRAFHDAGGTDLLPLEGVQFSEGTDVEVLDEGDWDSGTVRRDFGQHGVWVDGYGEGVTYFVEDRDEIRAYVDPDDDA